MRYKTFTVVVPLLAMAFALNSSAMGDGSQENSDSSKEVTITAGSKVFVAPAENGFDHDLRAALVKKQAPVVVVERKEDADFEITSTSDTQKAGAAKILITGSWHSREEASIRVSNLRSGVVAFAYSYHSDGSTHGRRSAAEACAKHLKQKIENR